MPSIDAKNVNHPGYAEPLNERKYTVIRDAMLAILPGPAGDESMTCADLEERVKQRLDEQQVPSKMFPKPGSVRWYLKAVQLDLEARGEIERVPRASPIRLRRR